MDTRLSAVLKDIVALSAGLALLWIGCAKPGPIRVPGSGAQGGGRPVYDVRGAPLTRRLPSFADTVAPAPGDKLFLTIDNALQQIVTEELQKMVKDCKARGGYAIMADPQTGDVWALAEESAEPAPPQRPDAGDAHGGSLGGAFEPGALLKPIVIASAFDNGVASPDTAFDCEQGMWVQGGRALRDSGPRLGMMQVRQIVQKSSSIGTAKVAVACGPQRVHDALLKFGFGAPTGLGLLGESSGFVPALAQWDAPALTRIALGQSIQATGPQVLQSYCTIANRGVMPQLRLVDRTETPTGSRREANPRRLKGRVISAKAAQEITDVLKLVTQPGGTAPKAAVPGRVVAGMTCTVQKQVSADYSASRFVAGFVGFLPADAPVFVLLVVANEPEGAMYGGTVAAPTFSRIAVRALLYLQVPQPR